MSNPSFNIKLNNKMDAKGFWKLVEAFGTYGLKPSRKIGQFYLNSNIDEMIEIESGIDFDDKFERLLKENSGPTKLGLGLDFVRKKEWVACKLQSRTLFFYYETDPVKIAGTSVEDLSPLIRLIYAPLLDCLGPYWISAEIHVDRLYKNSVQVQ